MKGTYSTILGGVKAALRYAGVRSIAEYIRGLDYTEIPVGYQRPLDIIIFNNSHNIYICIGTYWFGVLPNDTFGVVTPANYDPINYTIYRRGTQ